MCVALRHPGYAGSTLFTMAMPVILSSLWAFVPAFLTVAAIALRTALEDRMLRQKLDGYTDYARRVKYRLVPCLW